MTDNTQVTAGSGDFIRDKDRGAAKTQIMGVDLNIAGIEKLMAGFMPIGGIAVNIGANPTTVSTGQEAEYPVNTHAIPFVMAGHPNIQTIRLSFNTQQTNALIITTTTGIVVTKVRVASDNAMTDSPSILIGLGNPVPTTTGVLYSHPGLPGGFQDEAGNGSGIIGQASGSTGVYITTGAIASAKFIDVIVTCYVLPA